MYGEKAEQCEELKMDLEDVKSMYKSQVKPSRPLLFICQKYSKAVLVGGEGWVEGSMCLLLVTHPLRFLDHFAPYWFLHWTNIAVPCSTPFFLHLKVFRYSF